MTPTIGYPIRLGAIVAPYYLTAADCDEHSSKRTLADELTRHRPLIAGALMTRGLVPDFGRAWLARLAIDDPALQEFATFLEAVA